MDDHERDKAHAEQPDVEELKLPADDAADLEPDEEASEEVSGGTYAFKMAWPKKIEAPTIG